MRHALATMRSILYNCSIKLCMNFKLKRNCLWLVCVCVFLCVFFFFLSVRPPQPARCVNRCSVLSDVLFFWQVRTKQYKKKKIHWQAPDNEIKRPQWRRCSGLWGQKVKRKSIKAAVATKPDSLLFWGNFQNKRWDWRKLCPQKYKLCVVLSCQISTMW